MSNGKTKRVPQSERDFRVTAEVHPTMMGLLVAYADARHALETGTPGTVLNNPWHPIELVSETASNVKPVSELTGQIATAYASGLTQQQVAEQFGMHVQTVRRHLRLADDVQSKRLGGLSDEQLAVAKVLRDGGVSLRQLGALLGVAHTTIGRQLDDYKQHLQHKPVNQPAQIVINGLVIDEDLFMRAIVSVDSWDGTRIRTLAQRWRDAPTVVEEPTVPDMVIGPRDPSHDGRRLADPDLLTRRAVELSSLGWSYRKIAKELGVAHSTVRKLILELSARESIPVDGGA